MQNTVQTGFFVKYVV